LKVISHPSGVSISLTWTPPEYDADAMAVVTETLEVEGIRCERCVQRLAVALGSIDGLAGASATLLGEVTLAYDSVDVRTAAVAAIEAAGFSVA
jgi:copper chaperone CopZ